MRPVLATLPAPSLLVMLGLLALIALGIAVWLYWLRARQAYHPDYLYTGIAIVVLSAIMLSVLRGVGELRINAYGTMLMCGFLLGIGSAVRVGIRRGVPADRLLDLGLAILVGAIVGARVLYVILTPGEQWLDLPRVLHEGLGGLSFHGGLLGGLLTGSLYIHAAKLNYWRVVDSLAPGIAIGYAVTRIGCFLNGCCFGKPAPGLPWAMVFPHSPDAFIRTVPVHPTQLYASAMGFTMFGILLLLSRGRGLGRAGRLFMVLLMLEGVERFVMEIFRYPDPHFHGLLTPAQWASIVLVIGGLLGMYLLPRRPAVDGVEQMKVHSVK